MSLMCQFRCKTNEYIEQKVKQMEAMVKLLQEEELTEYREDLISCMEDSLKVNDLNKDFKKEGRNEYQKMMGYYYMGKASIVGALDGNRLIGYAQFFQKENGRMHLNQIAVREDCQGSGVGTLLLRAVERNAKECNALMMELFCNERNVVAKKFYQKYQYLTEKRLMIKII